MRLILIAAIIAASTSGAVAQVPPERRSLTGDAARAASTFASGVSAPLDWPAGTWSRIGAAAMGLAVLSSIDGEVRDMARRNQGAFLDDVARSVKPFGRELAAGTLTAFLLAGVVGGHEHARMVAFDGIAATALVSGLLVPALQAVTGRSRPWHGRGEHAFEPFSGRHSLPSGHAAQAFVTAAVVAAHHESVWVDVTAYALASAVGLSRMYHDAHHLTDVVAAAAIGTAAGRAVVRHGVALRGGRVVPDVGAGGIGIALRF
ncbi:MAG: phosphatase PAP2 family protein [Gemmatimonadetes bacterium]|nr:phosphatase PAP2 family protein [Gemmatimonadota bacterium]